MRCVNRLSNLWKLLKALSKACSGGWMGNFPLQMTTAFTKQKLSHHHWDEHTLKMQANCEPTTLVCPGSNALTSASILLVLC